MEHPQVARALAMGWHPPIPLAVYVDGVVYQQGASGRSDTVGGYWIINLVSGSRYLVAVARHSDECRCGCKSWCTTYPILHYISWQLEAMQTHRRPPAMHNGAAWAQGSVPDDPSLPFNACLIYIKGDWMEHLRTIGLASWGQHHACCQFCTLVKSELHTLADQFSSDNGCPWQLRTHSDYDESCRLCDRTVQINTQAQLQELVSSIAHLKKNEKVLGFGICKESVVINGTALLYGDRLEPSPALLDVQQVRSVRLPVSLTFWRQRLGKHSKLPLDPVNHRCQLFSEVLGTSPMRSLAIDELHTLHLGVVQRTASACIYRIVLANPWGFQGTTSSVVDRGVRMLWTDLKTWQADPASGVRHGEELRNLTPKMLGKHMGCSIQDCEFHLALACSVHLNKQMKHCFMSTCVGRIRFVLAISKGGSKLPDHPGCAMSMKAGESAHLLKFAIHALEKYTQEHGLEMFGEAGGGSIQICMTSYWRAVERGTHCPPGKCWLYCPLAFLAQVQARTTR